MRLLFLHNNFPGQYARIIRHLAGRKGIDILAVSRAGNRQPSPVRRIDYEPHRSASEKVHPALRYTEEAVIRGQAVYKALAPTRAKGWRPDLMLAHSGFGDGLFLKDLWPDARYMPYLEWYYRAYGSDASFFDRRAKDPNVELRIRMKNSVILQDLAAMDWGQSPTQYQKSQFPGVFHGRMSVLHDGVDTDYFSPDARETFTVGSHVFRHGDPLVTYIARGMEPYRGFPQFIEAVSLLQRMHAGVHAVVIGEDRIAYGPRDKASYKQWALETFRPDLGRLHFLGRQPLAVLRQVLRVSAAHVYLTAPFVLSWSMMEAMATGALIVGSDTEPVREVIDDGRTGLLVPFFEPQRLAQRLLEVLAAPQRYEDIRRRARTLMLQRYDQRELCARYVRLIETVAAGRRPGPAGHGPVRESARMPEAAIV